MHEQKQDLRDPWKRECKNQKSEKCPGAPKLGWIANVFPPWIKDASRILMPLP